MYVWAMNGRDPAGLLYLPRGDESRRDFAMSCCQIRISVVSASLTPPGTTPKLTVIRNTAAMLMSKALNRGSIILFQEGRQAGRIVIGVEGEE